MTYYTPPPWLPRTRARYDSALNLASSAVLAGAFAYVCYLVCATALRLLTADMVVPP